MMLQLHNVHLEPIADRALREDWGNGDWTTDLLIAPGSLVLANCVLLRILPLQVSRWQRAFSSEWTLVSKLK